MSFDDNIRPLQLALRDSGYERIRNPVDISSFAKADRVVDCEIIARKDFFNVMYMEAESGWRGIASDAVIKSQHSCMVITRYGDSHHIFTTVRNHGTHNAKPRHVVLETRSRPNLLLEFIQAVKASPHDDHIVIDRKVQAAFDKFSEYKQAIDEFGKNLSVIIRKTEAAMDQAIEGNRQYVVKAKKMLAMCKEVISKQIDMKDIKSMLLQHILTYHIFELVYDITDFHETNAVARSLEEIKKTLNMPYDKISYKTMELIAESVTDTDQRQEFLKKLYETFYEKYDPDRADKDGIVYTPSEAVNFMVKSTDLLLEKHFGKRMSDNGVSVLDPATGTGTFLVYVMKQIGKSKITQKYTSDLHANEISILPYYIAALNIEHTYKEMTGKYREFENICWMDTLDSGVKDYGKLTAHFGNDDNVKRMQRQQKASIRVAIGNPPYNAVQTSFNNANPADKYEHLDEKIQKSYYGTSRATNKNKSFDMYKRFLKWSSDRIKGKGMVVFISNNSFLNAKADDGIRRALYDEFDYIYVVNLKGNARLSGEARRRERGNVFGGQARVGVCVSFLIKTGEGHSEIRYAEVDDYATRDAKLQWLDTNTIETLKPRKIIPDDEAIWLNQTDNDFNKLCPVLQNKFAESIFKEYTLGVTTAKDDWVYDFDRSRLESKMKYYVSTYNQLLQKYQKAHISNKNLLSWISKQIKWSRTTLNRFQRNQKLTYSSDHIVPTLYRPFVRKLQYYAKGITHVQTNFQRFFNGGLQNLFVGFPNPAANVKFDVIGTDLLTDVGCVDIIQNIPLWIYDNDGKRDYNITKFGLELFQKHYDDCNITPEDIFFYVYAMFNDPKYERKYRHNLRRELPQIPLAKAFFAWSEKGKKLFRLHCDYNNADEYDLQRIDKKVTKNEPRLSFKQEKDGVIIIIDDATMLRGIPREIMDWTFKSKTPLEWVLTFYKEAKNHIRPQSSSSKKIREKFSTYRFSDSKEEVIVLLKRLTTVCVETVRLRNELMGMEWGPQPNLVITPIKKSTTKQARKTSKTKVLRKPSRVPASKPSSNSTQVKFPL